jgi:hypothetical protein
MDAKGSGYKEWVLLTDMLVALIGFSELMITTPQVAGQLILFWNLKFPGIAGRNCCLKHQFGSSRNFKLAPDYKILKFAGERLIICRALLSMPQTHATDDDQHAADDPFKQLVVTQYGGVSF